MKNDGRWLPSSKWIIKYVDLTLEYLEILYRVHGVSIEGLLHLLIYVLAQWSEESVSGEKTWHHLILPGHDHVFRRDQLALQGIQVKNSRFINQSNNNEQELDLSQIRLKYFREYFANLQLLIFRLTDQSYLRMRLKICYSFQPSSTYIMIRFY